jgi:hypothetical protein
MDHRDGFGQFRVRRAAQSDKLLFEIAERAQNRRRVDGKGEGRQRLGKLAHDEHPAGGERVASEAVEQRKGCVGRRAVMLGAKNEKQFGLVPEDSAQQVGVNQASGDQPNSAVRQWLSANASDAKLGGNFT